MCCNDLSWMRSERWWAGDMSRQEAEFLLVQEDKEGCFVVRNSPTSKLNVLSLYTKVPSPRVAHYIIRQNTREEYYLSKQQCFKFIPDLVDYYRRNRGGLISNLTTSPNFNPVPPVNFLSHISCYIEKPKLEISNEVLGSGSFGVVKGGKLIGTKDVAVKMIREGAMSEQEFIAEAEVMSNLQHQNLVQLLGICTSGKIYIVTEYMQRGSLQGYLRQYGTSLKVSDLLSICKQVCRGMAYLESRKHIHRNLAARNCLVGSDNVVKVSDFGLARQTYGPYVARSANHPLRWVPPEVLSRGIYSTKSDVWAYGVLMWEVFTCGEVPYCGLNNHGLVAYVMGRNILIKPRACPEEVYDVMKACWSHSPENRPSFSDLEKQLINTESRLEQPAAPSISMVLAIAAICVTIFGGFLLAEHLLNGGKEANKKRKR